MDYYKILNLDQEPFSNSPDPKLFFNSKQHLEALQKLEISIRLKRGLNVVTGDVGTGKTTLSRQLIQKINHDKSIKYFLILDPGFATTTDFLTCILSNFTGRNPRSDDETTLKELIKEYLFTQGVDNEKTIVLLIDEGQKLPLFCLEVLRELLNYETNSTKLLQIIILAQKEFNDIICKLDYFNDRINFRYSLSPLGFSEARGLIKFRLEQSTSSSSDIPVFSFLSMLAVYKYTKGFPRKIINLCHHIMLAMIIENKTKPGFFLVRSCAGKVFPVYRRKGLSFAYTTIAALIIVSLAVFFAFNVNKIENTIFPAKAPVVKSVVKSVVMPVAQYAIPQKKEAVVLAELINQTEPLIVPEPELIPVTQSIIKTRESMLEYPEFYGSLKVPLDVTLYHIVESFYGSYKKNYLDKVLAANLSIKNPDKIHAGLIIDLPVITDTYNKWNNDHICILFAQKKNLEKAFLTARKYYRKDMDIRILPGWNREKGFLFSIVLDKPFSHLAAAGNYRDKLGPINDAVLICEKISSFNQGRKIL